MPKVKKNVRTKFQMHHRTKQEFIFCIDNATSESSIRTYETHSAVKRPNAVLCKRMRSATDKRQIKNGNMQRHTKEEEDCIITFTVSILG